MMNFCNWLFVVLLFLFVTFKLFLRHSFNTFFFAKEQDRKRPFTSWICDSKTEMKVCHPWFVICNYFGPWTVPEPYATGTPDTIKENTVIPNYSPIQSLAPCMFFRLWRGSYGGIFVIRDYLFLFFMNRAFKWIILCVLWPNGCPCPEKNLN